MCHDGDGIAQQCIDAGLPAGAGGLEGVQRMKALGDMPFDGKRAYVSFSGRCEEVLDFYKKSIGAEVAALMRWMVNVAAPKA